VRRCRVGSYCESRRYQPADQRGDFIKAVSQVEAVPADHVAPWPGSSDPLSRAVVGGFYYIKGVLEF
jgi:hypothetical protein